MADRQWFRRNPKYAIAGGLAVFAGIAWVAFGYFGVHLLFIDNEVAEGPPVFASTETVSPPATTSTTPTGSGPSAPPTTIDTVIPAPAPAAPATSTPATSTPATTSVTTLPTTVATVATVPPVPEIVTEFSGTFVSLNHPTVGNAIVQGNGTGQRFLRFEQFETDNGPDLNVYLVNSAAGGVDDFVDLGNLKGNIGDQNYEIPPEVDLAVYDTVLIWCVRFSSGFGEALLVAS
ncbi:MAG TPA: DM13 domain-containing protein [Ilumatobacter sp.]|nr:DM13 domain-containing protein [Ilumatobacter sp.]